MREASKILIHFGNKTLYSGALGKADYQSLSKDRQRLNFLFGAMKSGEDAMEAIRHYQVRDTDLSSIGSLSPEPATPATTITSLIRTGSKAVTTGANSVTFSSPLPSANYTVTAWVIGTGESQYDLGTVTKSAGGFTVSDIIINGTLHYQAIINI